MIRFVFIVFFVFVNAFVFSQTAKVKISGKTYGALPDSYRQVLLFGQELRPASATLIGTVKTKNGGTQGQCDYRSTIDIAKVEARKVGANLLVITKHLLPGAGGMCPQISAEMLYLDEANYLAVLAQENRKRDSLKSSRFGNNPNKAILYVYRNKGEAGLLINYNINVGDSAICKMKNNTKYEIDISKEGEFELWAATESRRSVKLDVKFGNVYYLRCSMEMGIVVGRPALYLVDEHIGQAEFAKVEGRD